MARSSAATPQAYLAELDPSRAEQISAVRDAINASLQPGFVERIAWGMISWDVPLDVSGPTYNGQPLSYVALAAQKKHNALYLNCIDGSPDRAERLSLAFKDAGKRLDMGKSCLRFGSADDLAFDALMAEIGSATPLEFVARYRAAKS